jgi:hypothetical protein
VAGAVVELVSDGLAAGASAPVTAETAGAAVVGAVVELVSDGLAAGARAVVAVVTRAVVELESDVLVDAEVAGAADVADDGKAAACACREKTSKTASIPAATIATCTARRAMCLKVAWDTSSSRSVGRDRPDRPVPSR